jgi:hypothetical protein
MFMFMVRLMLIFSCCNVRRTGYRHIGRNTGRNGTEGFTVNFLAMGKGPRYARKRCKTIELVGYPHPTCL